MEEGAVVGNFLLGRLIGKGAQASVFQARHRFLDREAAVKVLQPQPDPMVRERFLREAKATASLEHPGIVRVLDCGIDGDVPYMAMELLLGGTLKELNVSRANGGYSLGEVLSVMVQATSALALAHTRGIVHRDLKPSNIFILNDGSLKLVDFGVAKVTGSELTRTGGFVGNISYAPFEQWRNAANVTPAADVYSLGAIMFEMIVGRLPPRSDPWEPGTSGASSELPAGTSLLRRGTPEAITNLLLSCLDENPDLRPQNAEEVCRTLKALSSGNLGAEKVERSIEDKGGWRNLSRDQPGPSPSTRRFGNQWSRRKRGVRGGDDQAHASWSRLWRQPPRWHSFLPKAARSLVRRLRQLPSWLFSPRQRRSLNLRRPSWRRPLPSYRR